MAIEKDTIVIKTSEVVDSEPVTLKKGEIAANIADVTEKARMFVGTDTGWKEVGGGDVLPVSSEPTALYEGDFYQMQHAEFVPAVIGTGSGETWTLMSQKSNLSGGGGLIQGEMDFLNIETGDLTVDGENAHTLALNILDPNGDNIEALILDISNRTAPQVIIVDGQKEHKFTVDSVPTKNGNDYFLALTPDAENSGLLVDSNTYQVKLDYIPTTEDRILLYPEDTKVKALYNGDFHEIHNGEYAPAQGPGGFKQTLTFTQYKSVGLGGGVGLALGEFDSWEDYYDNDEFGIAIYAYDSDGNDIEESLNDSLNEDPLIASLRHIPSGDVLGFSEVDVVERSGDEILIAFVTPDGNDPSYHNMNNGDQYEVIIGEETSAKSERLLTYPDDKEIRALYDGDFLPISGATYSAAKSEAYDITSNWIAKPDYARTPFSGNPGIGQGEVDIKNGYWGNDEAGFDDYWYFHQNYADGSDALADLINLANLPAPQIGIEYQGTVYKFALQTQYNGKTGEDEIIVPELGAYGEVEVPLTYWEHEGLPDVNVPLDTELIIHFGITPARGETIVISGELISANNDRVVETAAKSSTTNTLAIGDGAHADYNDSIAIGNDVTSWDSSGTIIISNYQYENVKVNPTAGIDRVDVGTRNYGNDRHIFMLGNLAPVDPEDSSELYRGAYVDEGFVLVGSAKVNEEGEEPSGKNPEGLPKTIGGVIVGTDVHTNSRNGVLIGRGVDSYDSSSLVDHSIILIGNDVSAGYDVPSNGSHRGIGIGFNAQVGGNNSIVMGYLATAHDENVIAIGERAKGAIANSIVLNAKTSTDLTASTDNKLVLLTDDAGLRVKSDGTLQVSGDGGGLWNNVSGVVTAANWIIANDGNNWNVAPTAISGAVAIGDSAKSEDYGSVAIGNEAYAQAYNTIAIGVGADSLNTSCISLGDSSYASGTVSMSLGLGSFCNSAYGISIGVAASTTSSYGLSLGYNAECDAFYGVSIGNEASATEHSGIAIGDESKSWSDYSIAIGKSAKVHNFLANTGGISIGKYATVDGTTNVRILMLTDDGGIRVNKDGSVETTADGGSNWTVQSAEAQGASTLSKTMKTSDFNPQQLESFKETAPSAVKNKKVNMMEVFKTMADHIRSQETRIKTIESKLKYFEENCC